MQKEKGRPVFWAGISEKIGEPIYLCRAIRSRLMLAGALPSLALGQQLK
jgi:hypothetical protein